MSSVWLHVLSRRVITRRTTTLWWWQQQQQHQQHHPLRLSAALVCARRSLTVRPPSTSTSTLGSIHTTTLPKASKQPSYSSAASPSSTSTTSTTTTAPNSSSSGRFADRRSFYHSLLRRVSGHSTKISSRTRDLLRTMRAEGVAFDLETYSIALENYRRSSDIPNAEALFNELVSDMPPTAPSSSASSASSTSSASSIPSASSSTLNALFTSTRESGVTSSRSATAASPTSPRSLTGVRPDVDICKAMLLVYVAARQPASALAFLRTMRERVKVEPDLESYNMVLAVFARMGKVHDVIQVLGHEMSSSSSSSSSAAATTSVRPDTTSYNELVRAYCTAHKVDRALEVVRLMRSIAVSPNTDTYALLLDGLLRAGEFGRMRLVFDEMLEHSVPPSQRVYTLLYNACYAVRDLAGARRMLDRMTVQGFKPHTALFQRLFDASYRAHKPESSDVDECVRVLMSMLHAGLTPDDARLHHLLEALVLQNKSHKVMDVVALFRNAGLAPRASIYRALIAHRLSLNKPKAAIDILRAMVALKVLPEPSSCRMLTNFLEHQLNHTQASPPPPSDSSHSSSTSSSSSSSSTATTADTNVQMVCNLLHNIASLMASQAAGAASATPDPLVSHVFTWAVQALSNQAEYLPQARALVADIHRAGMPVNDAVRLLLEQACTHGQEALAIELVTTAVRTYGVQLALESVVRVVDSFASTAPSSLMAPMLLALAESQPTFSLAELLAFYCCERADPTSALRMFGVAATAVDSTPTAVESIVGTIVTHLSANGSRDLAAALLRTIPSKRGRGRPRKADPAATSSSTAPEQTASSAAQRVQSIALPAAEYRRLLAMLSSS